MLEMTFAATNYSTKFVYFFPRVGNLQAIKGIRTRNNDWKTIVDSSKEYLVDLILTEKYSIVDLSRIYNISPRTLQKWAREANQKLREN